MRLFFIDVEHLFFFFIFFKKIIWKYETFFFLGSNAFSFLFSFFFVFLDDFFFSEK